MYIRYCFGMYMLNVRSNCDLHGNRLVHRRRYFGPHCIYIHTFHICLAIWVNSDIDLHTMPLSSYAFRDNRFIEREQGGILAVFYAFLKSGLDKKKSVQYIPMSGPG